MREHFDVETNDADDVWSPAGLIRRLQGMSGVFVTGTQPIDVALLAACPELRAVCSMAAGYNNTDVPACTAHGVLVSNAPNVLTETTADFGFALMMAAARRIAESEHFLRRGYWTNGATIFLLVRTSMAQHWACWAWAASGKPLHGVVRWVSACRCATTIARASPRTLKLNLALSTSARNNCCASRTIW